MRTNNESPKEAKRGSFGKNEKQPKSMTKVGDKKHGMAGRMKSPREIELEHADNRGNREIQSYRKKEMKKHGWKTEREYWTYGKSI